MRKHAMRFLVPAVVLALLGVGVPAAPASANGEVFPVMNTSESPPDGVWFRNSPHTADTRRVTGLGVYMNERVRVSCYASGDAVGAYGNTTWYYASNVSRPTAPGGITNVGWINTHYVNDGMSANHAYPGVTVCGSTTPPPPPTPPSPPAFDPAAETDRLLFHHSMAAFLQIRNSVWVTFPLLPVAALDWTSDLCSAPVSEPMRSRPKGYDFRPSCIRHDFGYRNYKKQNRFTEPARTSIDVKFKADMYAVCDQYKGWRHAAQGVECRRIADAYYGAVRACGGAVPAAACPDYWKKFGSRLWK